LLVAYPRPVIPPTAHAVRPLPSRVVGTLAALAAVLVLLVAGAPVALAHDRVLSVDPADGASVAVAPDQVQLVLSEAPIALGTAVEVRGPDGGVVSVGDPVIADATVTQALGGERPAGAYTVVWRVVSSDGHPIDGTSTFTAQTPAAPTVSPGPTESPTTTPEPTATPTPTPEATTASPTPAPAPGDVTGGSVPPWALALLGVGAAVTVIVLLVRRRVATEPQEPGPPPTLTE